MDLRRVVAAKIEIQFILLRAVEPLLAQLAGHERVHAGGTELGYGAVARAAAKRNGPRRSRSAFDRDDAWIKALEFRPEPDAGQAVRGDATNCFAIPHEKRTRRREPQLAGEQRVVADFRVA